MNSAPRLLIFDLDGTLIDSQHGIARSFNVALAAVGAAPVEHDSVFAMIGLPLTEMFGRVLPSAAQMHIDGCIGAYRDHYAAVEIPRTAVFPGVVETLAACRAAGRTLTVATTKIQAVAELAVEAAGLRPFFSLVVGGDSVPHHKPHPALVLRTLREFAYSPAEALVVGDSSYDILMAGAAGVASCGVTYGAQPADALRAAGATHLIDTMAELLPIVGLGPARRLHRSPIPPRHDGVEE